MSSASDSTDFNVQHLAHLAKLRLAGDEADSVHADLDKILRMINAMQSVATDGVETMSHPLDTTQRLRADHVTETIDVRRNQQSAPATEEAYYLVPKVIE